MFFFATAKVKLQQFVISEQIKFTIKAKQLFSNCQQQLQQASVLSRHITTSAIHHD